MTISAILPEQIPIIAADPDLSLSTRVNNLIETVHEVGVRIIGTAIDAGNRSIRTLVRYKFEILIAIAFIAFVASAVYLICAVGFLVTIAIVLGTVLGRVAVEVTQIVYDRITAAPPRLDGRGRPV